MIISLSTISLALLLNASTITPITNSMSAGIEPVTNWNLYPISQEVASTSRGGLTTDKVAIQDGVGAILLYGTSGGQTQTNNAPFNNLLMNNTGLLDTTNTLKSLMTNNVITIPSNTLNDINSNVFVGGTTTYLHTNGTACDDGNAGTTGETWLNDVCQGGVASTLACANGLVEENGVCYQELVNEVCGTDGVGTYNATTHMCEGTSLTFTQLQLGEYHNCGIDTVGDTYCWGRNNDGQLGLGHTTNQSTPKKLSKQFTQLQLGYVHTCGIDSVGDTYCWGYNASGQLGLGNTTQYTTPQKLSKQFTQLQLEGYHNCGIDSVGNTYCWGRNTEGQLGLGNTTNQSLPQKLSKQFTQLQLGYVHNCGIDSVGDTYCWGHNYYGQLGLGDTTNRTTPQKLSKQFTQLHLGMYHSCGIDSIGDTYCWGYNASGQLGLGDTTDKLTPQKLAMKFNHLILGASHTCGIEQGTGDTYCWGNNANGQLGLGNTTQYTTPQKLTTTISYEKTCETGFTLEETTGRCWQDKQ